MKKTAIGLTTRTIICAILGALAFYSCQSPIGLGRMLNLDTPVVEIEEPASMKHVGQRDGNTFLLITGTAVDKIEPIEEVAAVSVIVERVTAGNLWKQEFIGERDGRGGGVWSRDSSTDSTEWKKEDGTWTESSNGAFVQWGLTILMNEAPDGEYLITVSGQNSGGNAGADAQRRFILDKEGPVTFIRAPSLESYDDTPDELGYRLQNPALMDRMHNQSIRIQYEINDNFSIAKLTLQLYDQDGISRYSNLFPTNARGGRLDIDGSEINKGKREPIQLTLVTTAEDRAGNIKVASHGWLMWWPDSDKPWITGVGQEDKNQAKRSEIYPGSDVQVLAYDDDGVDYVEMRIYRKDDSKPIPEYDDSSEAFDITRVIRRNTPLVEGGAPSTFFAFTFTAPEDCDEYRIEADIYDINNPTPTMGEPKFVRYFYIMDNNAPSVELTKPERLQPMYGDKDGTFTVSGTASDGVMPYSLKLVWIHPNSLNTDQSIAMQSQFLYQSADYDGWNITDEEPGGIDKEGDEFWKDDKGNIIWNLTSKMGNDYIIPATALRPRRIAKNFTKEINLFEDLKMRFELNAFTGKFELPVALTAQSFVLRVEGSTPLPPDGRAITVLHSARGDITPPTLEIKTVTVERHGFDPVVYLTSEKKEMAALKEDDLIFIEGTWTEDSFEKWQDTNRMNLTVHWAAAGIDNDLPTVINTNGTWKAGPFRIINEAMTIGGFIDAQLTDMGGNMGRDTYNARVDTSLPNLMFISADNPDGAYKAGEKIYIYLEFSKVVEYNGNDVPYIELNNGVRVDYVENPYGLPEDIVDITKHYFVYTVADANPKEDNSDLTVVSITYTGDWQTADDNKNKAEKFDHAPNGGNLADNKDIVIDTIPPTIASVRSLTAGIDENGSGGHYRAGQAVYIAVQFSESVIPTGISASELTLNVNSAGGSGKGIAPSTMGPNTLLFIYTIAAPTNSPANSNGDNTPVNGFLNVESFILGDGAIADTAGNQLNDFTIPAGRNIADTYTVTNTGGGSTTITGRNIVIDTLPPDPPTISGLLTNGETHPAPPGLSFTINSTEPSPRLEYRVAEDGLWITYNGTVTLEAKGDYFIRARQTDIAGNVSQPTNMVKNTISRGDPLLSSFGGTDPGTYKTGNSISIYLILREAVTVTGNMSLTLNIPKGNPRTVPLTAVNTLEKRLEFTFTVASGDDIDVLTFSTINMTGVTLHNGVNDVTNELDKRTGWDTDDRGFHFFRTIEIITSMPVFENHSLSPDARYLYLNFNKAVDKGTGDIVITQVGHNGNIANDYIIPAVLTRDEYNRFGGAAAFGDPRNQNSYYIVGTNGTTPAGVADTAEKYILRYDIDTAGNSAATTAVRNILVGPSSTINAHRVTVPVVTSSVEVVTDPDNIRRHLRIDLGPNSGNALFVKGVDYTVTFPATVIQDSQSNQLAAGGTVTFTNLGVNPPFIRVEKKRGTVREILPRPPEEQINIWETQTRPALWVTGSDLQVSSLSPGAGWESTSSSFTVIFGETTEGDGLSSTERTGAGWISSTQLKTQGGDAIQGDLFKKRSGAGGPPVGTLIISNWPANDGYTGDWDRITNFWVNPYQAATILRQDRWNSGDVRFRQNQNNIRIWVNTTTGTHREADNTSSKQNYIHVRNAGTNDVLVGTRPVQFYNLTVTQPYTAKAKIDCQTPNATITYKSIRSESAMYNASTASTPQLLYPRSGSAPSVTMPTATTPSSNTTTQYTGDYTGEFTLGVEGSRVGYLYGIRARAERSGYEALGHEVAARSVIQFNGFSSVNNVTNRNNENDNTSLADHAKNRGRSLHLWLRGGDRLSGDNQTPGFPLSWDEGDHTPGPSSAQLLTEDGDTDNWYWVTWEITARPAYFHFLAGTTTTDTAAARGPHDWSWSKNSWTFMKDRYPLRPGESLRFNNGRLVSAAPDGTYEFFARFSFSRGESEE